MARHFVRSFVIAAALSPFVHAGPCRPASSSVAVVSTTAETSVATGSATTHTKESSLTESLSGTSTETSVTISESGSSTGTSTETTLATSKTESGSTTAEQSTTSGSALSTDVTTSASESESSTGTTLATSKTESGSTTAEQSTTSGSALSTDVTTSASESESSTGTTLAATTSTECPEPEPPVYDDPFTHTDTEVAPATTSEAATTTEGATVTIVPRNFIRRGHPEIFVRDATSEAVPVNGEDPTTTTAEATSTTEDATTTTGEATTSGEDTTTGETTATSEDTTATTEAPTTTTEEATTTASETATGCINNMERPTPEGAVCGTRGSIQRVSDDWRYLGEGVSSSLMECYASCQGKSNCVTFFYEKNAQCTLYMGTITQLMPDPNGSKSYQTSCFCDTGIDPAPTCSYADPFSNGGFEDGTLSPWVEDPNPGGYDPVYSKVVRGGESGSYHFQTGQFDYDKSLWLYQDIEACGGTTFTCSYAWWWNEYYAIRQRNGNYLIPYVRVYQGDTNVVGNRWPENESETKTWMPAEFTFTMPSSGKTRIWFVASSPQGEWINNSDDPCTPDWVHRPNWFALDSIACRAW